MASSPESSHTELAMLPVREMSGKGVLENNRVCSDQRGVITADWPQSDHTPRVLWLRGVPGQMS